MSTRAELAIQTPEGDWQHVYVHYDGYPSAMLPALAAHDPQAILAAREIREITPNAIEAFTNPREPQRKPEPTARFDHLYILRTAGATPDTHSPAPEENQPMTTARTLEQLHRRATTYEVAINGRPVAFTARRTKSALLAIALEHTDEILALLPEGEDPAPVSEKATGWHFGPANVRFTGRTEREAASAR